MTKPDPYQIKTIEELRRYYDPPNPLVVKSKIDLLHDHMLHFMRLSPLVAIASDTDTGLDCSPRGGEPGFVKAIDRRTIAFADWPGNNKLETFSNIITSGRMGMLFMAPRLDVFMRINGDAIVTREPAVLEILKEKDKTPKAAVRNFNQGSLFSLRQGPSSLQCLETGKMAGREPVSLGRTRTYRFDNNFGLYARGTH